MLDAIMLLLGLRAIEREARDRNARPVVPEPEFVPFKLSRRGAGPASPPRLRLETSPAGTPRTPRTLEELGVPRSLAAEIEGAFRAMGQIDGERIVGFTFRAPDGAVHPLRAGTAAGKGSAGQAA